MIKRPLIGITPAYNYPEDRMFMKSAYANGIIKAGGLAIILSLNSDKNYLDQYLDAFDGFLFVGGQDIDATQYGEENLNCNGPLNPARDEMEIYLAKAAIEADKPVFGICRGNQVINVAMGGTLYQDVQSQFDRVLIKHVQDAPTWHSIHSIGIENDSHLHRIFNSNTVMVNSYHHQTVKDIAPGFKATGFSPDGLIEAIEHKSRKFVLGVQWHPELMWEKDPRMLQLFKYFVENCNRPKEKFVRVK